MHDDRPRIFALSVALVLSTFFVGSTCTPKDTCSAVQRWNVKVGVMETAAWGTWTEFYENKYMGVVADLIHQYDAELSDEELDELILALEEKSPPETDIVIEVYEKYQAEMKVYNDVAKKLETALTHTADNGEILEHAMIACQSFTDKEVRRALTEVARGLLDIVTLLKDIGVDVPEAIIDAKDIADSILAEIGAGQGF